MLGIAANDHQLAMPFDDLAFFTDGFDRSSHFHFRNLLCFSPRRKIDFAWLCSVFGSARPALLVSFGSSLAGWII